MIRSAGDGKENSHPGPGARGPGLLSLMSLVGLCAGFLWLECTCRSPGQLVTSAGLVVRKPFVQKQADGVGSGQSPFGKSPQAGKAAEPECGADVWL